MNKLSIRYTGFNEFYTPSSQNRIDVPLPLWLNKEGECVRELSGRTLFCVKL